MTEVAHIVKCALGFFFSTLSVRNLDSTAEWIFISWLGNNITIYAVHHLFKLLSIASDVPVMSSTATTIVEMASD